MPAANESVIMTMFMALSVKVNRLRHATGEREARMARSGRILDFCGGRDSG